MVANKLREFFKKNSMTQAYLAELMCVSKKTIDSKFYRDGFSDEDLIKIADVMGFKLAFVKGDEVFILNPCVNESEKE